MYYYSNICRFAKQFVLYKKQILVPEYILHIIKVMSVKLVSCYHYLQPSTLLSGDDLLFEHYKIKRCHSNLIIPNFEVA